jgi:hypothetical protein
MPVFLNIFTLLKKYWQPIVLVVLLSIGYAYFVHQQSNFAATLKQLNDSHQTEVDQITQAAATEQKQHAAETKELQDSLTKIQSDYAAQQQLVVVQETQETQTIIKKYNNDNDGLAALLASKIGLTVTK